MKEPEEDFARLKRLGNRAAEILDDSDFKEILVALKGRAIRDWANTMSNAAERREELYRDVQAVGRLENYMRDLGQTLRAEEHKQDRRNDRNR